MYFQFHYKFYYLGLLYHVFEYLPPPTFPHFSHRRACYFENPPFGFIACTFSCVPRLSLCMFWKCVGHWCCIRETNNTYYCYTYFLLDLLATAGFDSCLIHMVALSCWFPPQHFALLPRPLVGIIWLATLEFDLPVASTVWKSYHLLFLAW